MHILKKLLWIGLVSLSFLPFGSPLALASEGILVSGESYRPIPELINLPLDAIIPAETFGRYDSRLVAATLVARYLHLFESQSLDTVADSDSRNQTYIQISLHSKDLSQILANGIRNQHQVARSGGTYAPEFRANAENAMIRLRIESHYTWGPENEANQLRPKYSHLTFAKNKTGLQTIGPAARYGNVIATLKDEVKFRSTFTRGDSLLYAGVIANSRIPGGTQDHSLYSDYVRKNPDVFSGYLFSFFYRSIETLTRFLDSPYWEAQIWGHLSLADVDHFLVNCPDLEPPLTESEWSELKSAGAPIYNCDVPADRSHWAKGKEVYPGDLPLQRALQTPMTGTHTRDLLTDK